MHAGGRRVICTDPTKWLTEVPLARPTHISAPPLFWTTLQHEYNFLNSTRGEKHAVDSIHRVLGNRVVSAHTGGASVPQSVITCFQELGYPLDDLYGCREAGGIARNGEIYPGVEVHILPLEDIENKAIDLREMMLETHKNSSEIGEIIVHTPKLIPQYFNNAQSTDAAFMWFNGKRFYRTGDIGCFKGDAHKKKLHLLGRVGASVKLESGTWLHPTKVETVLESSSLVCQALVYAPPGKIYPVAVVVLSPFGRTQVESNENGSVWLLNELRFCCAHHHLRPQEIPQALHIELVPWSEAQGLLTPTMKKKRRAIMAEYETLLLKLFDDEKHNNHHQLALSDAFLSALNRAGLNMNGVHGNSTLAEIGAHSLAVARVVQIFRENKAEVPVKSMYLQSLTYLDSLLSRTLRGEQIAAIDDDSQPSFEAHLTSFEPLPRSISVNLRNGVFVTGGTGFFGSYLIPQVLQAFPICLVYVLIRGSDDRIQSWLTSTRNWEGCERIRVMQGDVSLPKLGLSVGDYNNLQSSLSDVFHCAARVDIAAPLEAFLAVNVQGTKSVVDLCLQARARLHYFSSLSALASNPQDNWNDISADELAKKTGYGASKVLAERMIHSAVSQNGLEVRVIRTGTVCGGVGEGDQWNTTDFIFLLLKAWFESSVVVLQTSIVFRWLPASFVASAMIKLALAPEATNRCFNLVGRGPKLAELAEQLFFQSRAVGRPCHVIDSSSWPHIAMQLTGDNALLREQFAQINFCASANEESSSTESLLHGLGLQVPSVGESHVSACIKRVISACKHLQRNYELCVFCGQNLVK